MTYKLEILPGILEHSWDEIEKKLQQAQTFAQSVHIDIIDGIFVNNKTFLDPSPFTPYAKSLQLELHMMVKNPIEYVEPFAKAGFTRFLGHIEMMEDQQKFLSYTKQFGEAGLALDGPTEISNIHVPFSSLDSILIYTSHQVGFSGPAFLQDRLEKIKAIRERTDKPIEVDGGITDRTLPQAKKAGATRFASTSFLFSNNEPHQQYTKLESLLNS